jgi:uncharacterized membrane protein YccC
LEQLVSSKPDPLPWGRALRAGIAITLPVALGLVFGRPQYGAAASIGALCAALADIRGPYRSRLRRIGLAMGAGTAGFGIGATVAGHGALSLIVVVAIAVLSALTSAAGNNASLASLQLLVFTILATGPIGRVLPPPLGMALFAAGGGVLLILSVALWPVRPTAPEREVIAGVLRALGGLLASAGGPGAERARLALTGAVNAAYDTLLGARSRIGGHEATYRKLFAVLTESTPAIEAAVALMRSATPAPPELLVATERLAQAVLTSSPPPELPPVPADGPAAPDVRALHAGLAQIAAAIASGEPGRARRPRPGWRERTGDWLESVGPGSAVWTHAVRLGLCVLIAELLRGLVFASRGYWIPLTVAIVLKPDFGSVFGRALLRGGGTVLGVLLGAAVLVGVRGGAELVLVMAVLATLLPLAITRNYGMFATIMTPLVIVQLDIAHQGQASLVLARLVDTTLGCAIVLIFGYLIWPSARRPRIGGEVASALEAVAAYLELAFAPDPTGRSTLRRRSYRALSNLRTAFQRVLVEPSPAARRAAAWWPVVVALERLTDAITRTVVAGDRSEPEPAEARAVFDGEDVGRLAGALREAASRVRQGRTPPEPPAPVAPPLAEVAAEVTNVCAVLRGPAGRSGPAPVASDK